jgi:hypothetical protein
MRRNCTKNMFKAIVPILSLNWKPNHLIYYQQILYLLSTIPLINLLTKILISNIKIIPVLMKKKKKKKTRRRKTRTSLI